MDQRYFNVENETKFDGGFSMLLNVDTMSVHNVGATLIQRCFNLASTLVKPILNPIRLVMIVDCVIVIRVKYMNSFYSAI